MNKYIKDKNGNSYMVDFFCIIDRNYRNSSREGKTTLYVKGERGWSKKTLSVYFRPERTLDDHMGNTECGYYVVLPLPTGERKRVYMF